MAGHVFISYSRTDQAYVTRLVEFLSARAIPVWVDHKVDAGDHWADIIRDKVDTCAAFVVVMSPAAEKSPWVSREIHRAESQGRPVLPVLLDGEVFFRLGDTQYEDVRGGRLPGVDFIARLRSLTGASGSGPSTPDDQPEEPPFWTRRRVLTTVLTVAGVAVVGTGTAVWLSRSGLDRGTGPAPTDSPTPTPTPTPIPVPPLVLPHPDQVAAVAFSPDGTRVATGCWDHAVRVWNAQTGELQNTLTGHTDTVESVAWSPDGLSLASGSVDKTARIWDPVGGAAVRTLRGHTDIVWSVAWMPQPGTARLATAGHDRLVYLWNTQTGARVQTLSGHQGPVMSVAWSPNGARLATASRDNTARVWDTPSATPITVFSGHTNWVLSVAWSPEGDRVVSDGVDGIGRVWDLAGTQVLTLTGHTNQLYTVAWSPLGDQLATGGADADVRLWDATTGTQLRTIKADKPTDVAYTVAFSPDGGRLAIAKSGKTAVIVTL